MNKRDLILRKYQEPASDFAMEHNVSVLAIAPNGGKTEISIDVLCRLFKQNNNLKALVLTHSTTVLKDNYTDRLDKLNIPFNYSSTFDKNCNVHICLPNSEHLIKGRYDFLIVDEAHENYLAERVQRIVKKIKPKKQLLLTGTPSKFIKKGGYNIYTIAANEISEDFFSKLQIELVASNFNWSKEIDAQYNIKQSYKFKKNDTKKALEDIIIKLINRVRLGFNSKEFNDKKLITKLKSWCYTYKKLGKTIIICHSIKQANDVNEILTENKVNSTVSHSETDIDSSKLSDFKKNKYNVLIVVDRARLGYSDDDLYNIIDMSGSHNPNIIYQIFSRVLRGNYSMQKYYLKVTTQEYGMMDFTHACVSAALMLTDKKYLSTFNGSNFNGIKIPIIKNKQKKTTKNHKSSKVRQVDNKLLFPEFTNDVIDMFKNIIHDLDEPVSIYKMITIKEVRAILSQREIWTEEKIFASARGEF